MSVPGTHFSWDYNVSPDDLRSGAVKTVEKFRAAVDRIGALKPEEVTFENVLYEIADLQRRFSNEEMYFQLPKFVSPSRELRGASTDADKMIQKFNVETSMRSDIFEKLLILEQRDTSALSAEMRRFLERMVKLGKRNGLQLSKEVQGQVKELLNEISDLSIQFVKVINEENSTIEFTEEELEGVPRDFIQSLETTGKRRVTMKPPHYLPIMTKAKNPDTRRRMGFAYAARCLENTATLEQLATLRHKKAILLGYTDHVSYVTELLMAKSKETVYTFLSELAKKLQPSWQKERQLLLQYKEKECHEMGIPFDGKMNSWDVRYYANMVKELEYNVCQEKLQEYFPLDAVIKGLAEIYQKLLGLTFIDVTTGKFWHPDVKLYKVADATTGELVGYFATDLFPREGKYGHFCNLTLQPACKTPDGTRQIPFVAVICNFTKPTADRPSLLTHREVETMFHEFGHTMHFISSKTDLAMFESTKVEWDFLECPAQMLENWVWEAEPLKLMTAHYVTGEPLPPEMLRSLVASRLAGVASSTLRLLCLGLFDQIMHTQSHVDTQKLFREIQKTVLGYPTPEGTNKTASFLHMACRYDGRYYAYLWSQVFSMDMFSSRFKKEGVLNKETGLEYRRKVLQPGASQDPSVTIRNFLGRDPNESSFLISKGLSV